MVVNFNTAFKNLSHPICCQSPVSSRLSMRHGAADLRLINALGISLHTGHTIGTVGSDWLTMLWSQGTVLNKKQIQINNLLQACQVNRHYTAPFDMQGRLKTVQLLMMEYTVREL